MCHQSHDGTVRLADVAADCGGRTDQAASPKASVADPGVAHIVADREGGAGALPTLTVRLPVFSVLEGGVFEVMVERTPSDQASSTDIFFREDIATFLGFAGPENLVGGLVPRTVNFAPSETNKILVLQTIDLVAEHHRRRTLTAPNPSPAGCHVARPRRTGCSYRTHCRWPVPGAVPIAE